MSPSVPYDFNSYVSRTASFMLAVDCIKDAKPSKPKIESFILFFFFCQFATLITDDTKFEENKLLLVFLSLS